MKATFITDDKYLFGKASIELSGTASLTSTAEADSDLLIYDCECSLPMPEFSGKVILLSRVGCEGATPLPLKNGDFVNLISSTQSKSRLSLNEKKRMAVLDGAEIPLTAHEFSLLSNLMKNPNGISRGELSMLVFGEINNRLLNLYVHYLRNKLEVNGERIIISERGSGYILSKKITGG